MTTLCLENLSHMVLMQFQFNVPHIHTHTHTQQSLHGTLNEEDSIDPSACFNNKERLFYGFLITLFLCVHLLSGLYKSFLLF